MRTTRREYSNLRRWAVVFGIGATAVLLALKLRASPPCSYGGLTDAQESALGADTVGDGIPDWWRALYFGGSGTTTNSSSCASCDPDGDGISNLEQYLRGTNPTNSLSGQDIFFVNGTTGLDSYTGRSPIVRPPNYGPKLTLQAALNLCLSNDIINIAAGTYTYSTNSPFKGTIILDPHGAVTLIPVDNPVL
jgi:hypothetical protein